MIKICKSNIDMNRRRNGKRGDDSVLRVAARKIRHDAAAYCRMFRGYVPAKGGW